VIRRVKLIESKDASLYGISKGPLLMGSAIPLLDTLICGQRPSLRPLTGALGTAGGEYVGDLVEQCARLIGR
jgi:hypothetical protein